MKYGLDVRIDEEFAEPQILVELALEAEKAGWDGFFVQDAMVADAALVDPIIALAAIAAHTKYIRIGAFMTALPRRRPWKVARETVSLDHLSNGRLIFGAGSGFEASDFGSFGEETELKARAEKLDEGLMILSGLWTGEPFTFQGHYYQVNNVRFTPKPIQSPRIPIWIGGRWPHRKPFLRAAHWDGIYVMTLKANGEHLTPAEIVEIASFIKSHRERSEPFDIAFADETLNDMNQSTQIIKSYQEAGVTWWLEGIWGTHEEMRTHIKGGPPRI